MQGAQRRAVKIIALRANARRIIEPNEHREEADTIPARGVNPESRAAPGLRPALCTSVGLVAPLLGLGYIFFHVQGLTPLPILVRQA